MYFYFRLNLNAVRYLLNGVLLCRAIATFTEAECFITSTSPTTHEGNTTGTRGGVAVMAS